MSLLQKPGEPVALWVDLEFHNDSHFTKVHPFVWKKKKATHVISSPLPLQAADKGTENDF